MQDTIEDRLLFLSAIKSNIDNQNNNPSNHIISKQLNVDPEILGGNVWKTVANYVTVTQPGFLSLHGFSYTCGGINAGSGISSVYQYDDTANSWSTKTSVSAGKYGLNTFNLNEFGYACGGNSFGSYVSTCEKYNDSANSWSSSVTGLTTGRYAGAGLNLNGFGYVFGGRNASALSVVEQYNDSSNSWTSKTVLPATKYDTSRFYLNSFGYIICGQGGAQTETYRYDDTTDTYVNSKAYPNSLFGAISFTVSGFGYTCSGYSGTFTSAVNQYNDAARTWSAKSPDIFARRFLAGFSLNEFGYALGGSGSSDYSDAAQYRPTNMYYFGRFKASAKTPIKVLVATNVDGYAKSLPVWIRTDGTNWKYMESNVDSLVKAGSTVTGTLSTTGGYYQYELTVGLPPTWIGTGASGGGGAVGGGYWSTKAGAGTARHYVAGFSLNGFGYVCNGYTGAAASSEVNQYNDSANTWTTKAGGGTARYGLAGFSLNGFGYICDGATSGGVYSSLVDQYNDITNAWASRANGGTARANLSGFSLNGFSYISSGLPAAVSSEVNQYNDTANTWSTKAGAGTARRGPAGFSLNGFGYTCNGFAAANSSEVNQYNDSANTWTTKAGGGTARYNLTGFSLKGFGHICNGIAAAASSEVNQYNDAANIWSTKAGGGTARQDLAGFSLNEFGYICNGLVTPSTYYSEVNQYVPNPPIPLLTVVLNVLEK